MVIHGTRLVDGVFADDPFRPGSYGRVNVQNHWEWRGCTPNGHTCNLSAHEVIEHDDGSISVKPSIRVSMSDKEVWHGYLEQGNWKQV
jgi:hypothetical protein